MYAMNNSYKFFKNLDCKYYPCHKNIEEINCLFCYCPLYFFDDCGGDYKINKKGFKDCKGCIKPHIANTGYDFIITKLSARIKKGV